MERQQNDYRKLLNIANRSQKDYKNSIVNHQSHLLEGSKEDIVDKQVYDTAIWKDINQKIHSINFFQFCHLLERINEKNRALKSMNFVRFKRVSTLNFPSAELADMFFLENEIIPRVKTTFLGLYGVDSVLPEYFLHDIAVGKEGSDSLECFLDIFHHKISELFYYAWKKYRYPIVFSNKYYDNITSSLLCLAGLDRTGEIKTKEDSFVSNHILGLLSIFYQRSRTADGVKVIINHFLPHANILVDEFYPKKVPIESSVALSKDNPIKLNFGSIVIGTRMRDPNNSIKVTVELASYTEYNNFIQNPIHFVVMNRLFKLYLGYKFSADVFVKIKKEWQFSASLKKTSRCILGINTFSGKQITDKLVKLHSYRPFSITSI